MNATQRPIFRDEAVRRYATRHENAVLPHLVQPRWFFFLWLLVGMLLAGVAIAWFAQVPVFASGTAVVARQPGTSNSEPALVVAFLPAEFHARLAVGQPMWIRWDGPAGTVRTPVRSVQPDIDSPETVRARYGATTAGPVAVVTAAFVPKAGLPPDAYFGSVGQVDVEIGSQRVLSLLAGMGPRNASLSAGSEGGAP